MNITTILTQRSMCIINKRGILSIRPQVPIGLIAYRMTLSGLSLLVGIAMWIGYEKALNWYNVNQAALTEVKAAIVEPPTNNVTNAVVEWIRKTKGISPDFASIVTDAAFNEAHEKKLDPFLLIALMRVESQFNFAAVSPKGAIGLTQVLPQYHTEKFKSVASLYDPKINIRVGAQVLKEYLDRQNGNERRALLQYNGSLQIDGAGYGNKVLSERDNLMAAVQSALLKE